MLHFSLMIFSWSLLISIVGFSFIFFGLTGLAVTTTIPAVGYKPLLFAMSGMLFLGIALISILVVAKEHIVPNSYIQQQSRVVKRYIRSDLVLTREPLNVGELVHIQRSIPRHKIAQQQLASAM